MSGDNVVPIRALKFSRDRVTIDKLRGRLGHFTFTDEAVQLWPDLCMQVMGKCIVLQAGRCSHNGATVYLAISEQFDLVVEGEQPPMYEWIYVQGKGMCATRVRPPAPRG